MCNHSKIESSSGSSGLASAKGGIGSTVKRIIRRQKYVRLGSVTPYGNGFRVRKLKVVRLGSYGGHARRQLQSRGKPKSGSILHKLKDAYSIALTKMNVMSFIRTPKVSPVLALGLGSQIDFKLARHEKLYLEYVNRSIADGRGY